MVEAEAAKTDMRCLLMLFGLCAAFVKKARWPVADGEVHIAILRRKD